MSIISFPLLPLSKFDSINNLSHQKSILGNKIIIAVKQRSPQAYMKSISQLLDLKPKLLRDIAGSNHYSPIVQGFNPMIPECDQVKLYPSKLYSDTTCSTVPCPDKNRCLFVIGIFPDSLRLCSAQYLLSKFVNYPLSPDGDQLNFSLFIPLTAFDSLME